MREAVILNYAIVDLGSNTIRLSVYRILPEGNDELLFSKKEMAGLVNYIIDGVLSSEGILRACSILMKFCELLGQFRIKEMHVFATASPRNIRNTEEAVQTIHRVVGIDVEVLSGSLEAELGYYGALLMDTVCGCLCKKELYVSRSGVREGYLYHELLKEERRPE